MSREQHNKVQVDYYRPADHPTSKLVDSDYVKRHITTLLTQGDLHGDQKVLEVGAGVGRFSRMLKERGIDVTASDISSESIAKHQKYLPEIPSFVSDVNDLPQQYKQSFDAVVGFFMLHHLEDLQRAFTSMARMLKPGGKVVFCEPNAWYFPFYLQILLMPGMRWSVDKGVLNMRRGVLSSALENSGFNNVEYFHYGYLPPQLYNRGWGKYLDHGMNKMPLPAQTRAFQIITANYEG